LYIAQVGQARLACTPKQSRQAGTCGSRLLRFARNDRASDAMTDHLRRIERALLSVSDKTGLVAVARALAERGVELFSTGGTAKALAEAGLAVIDVAQLTFNPEMTTDLFNSLLPKVHAG